MNRTILPRQVDVLFGKLAIAISLINALLIFNNFDTFTVPRLFQTMPGDHIQLADLILKHELYIDKPFLIELLGLFCIKIIRKHSFSLSQNLAELVTVEGTIDTSRKRKKNATVMNGNYLFNG